MIHYKEKIITQQFTATDEDPCTTLVVWTEKGRVGYEVEHERREGKHLLGSCIVNIIS
jgi:hypothetical protein